MREIKFRAWDKKKKSMNQFDRCHVGRGFGTLLFGFSPRLEDYGVEKNKSAFTFMQYTGLKDKNGKEIYESDIVLSDPKDGLGTCDNLRKYKVFWGVSGWELHNMKDGVGGCPVWSIAHATNEIIGNIYENPELLDDKNNP